MATISMRDVIQLWTFLAFALAGCIDPATQTPNATNNNTQLTNNSTQSTNNATNNVIGGDWGVHDSRGLAGFFEFSSGSSPFAGAGGALYLEGAINADQELNDIGSIGFVAESLRPLVEANRGLSFEIWWAYEFVDSGDVVAFKNDQTPILSLRRVRGQPSFLLTTATQSFEIPNVVFPNEMQHVSMTVDDRFIRLYIDGILCFSALSNAELVDALSNTTDIQLADEGTYFRYRSFALYGRTLLAAEVAHHAVLGVDNIAVGTARDDLFSHAFRSAPTIDDAKAGFSGVTFTPTSTRDGIQLSASDETVNAALKFRINPINFDQLTVRSATVRLGTVHFRPQGQWYFKIYALARSWDPLSVSWLEAQTNQSWLEPGGTGDVEAELANLSGEQGIGDSQTELFRLDVTPYWSAWVDSNPGLLLSSRSLSATFNDGPNQSPALLVVGTGSIPMVVGQVEASRVNTRCRVSQNSTQGADLEVYVDGELAYVTSGPFVDIEMCPPEVTIVWRGIQGQLSESQVLSF